MTTEKQVFNSLNAGTRQIQTKKFTLPSQTIPDQSLSLRTILEKHARGLDVGGTYDPIYDEDEISEGINPKTLDLVDLQELGALHKETLEGYKMNQEKAEKKKQEEIKQAEKEALRKEIEMEIQKNSTNIP